MVDYQQLCAAVVCLILVTQLCWFVISCRQTVATNRGLQRLIELREKPAEDLRQIVDYMKQGFVSANSSLLTADEILKLKRSIEKSYRMPIRAEAASVAYVHVDVGPDPAGGRRMIAIPIHEAGREMSRLIIEGQLLRRLRSAAQKAVVGINAPDGHPMALPNDLVAKLLTSAIDEIDAALPEFRQSETLPTGSGGEPPVGVFRFTPEAGGWKEFESDRVLLYGLASVGIPPERILLTLPGRDEALYKFDGVHSIDEGSPPIYKKVEA